MEPFSPFIGDATRAFLVPRDRVTTSHDELHRVLVSKVCTACVGSALALIRMHLVQVELATVVDMVIEYDIVVTPMEGNSILELEREMRLLSLNSHSLGMQMMRESMLGSRPMLAHANPDASVRLCTSVWGWMGL
jgi:hypothetical protein